MAECNMLSGTRSWIHLNMHLHAPSWSPFRDKPHISMKDEMEGSGGYTSASNTFGDSTSGTSLLPGLNLPGLLLQHLPSGPATNGACSRRKQVVSNVFPAFDAGHS